MKMIVNIARVLVGILFVFSGLIKANDPLGLSYKMQEFFEIWNEGLAKSSFFLSGLLTDTFRFLHDQSLALSVIMIAFEIIAGIALLIGWRMKLFSWLLLLLIIFFTFLTGYAFLSGKFKNCGCFGDCIPITPLTSFLKDVLLTLLIFFLFFNTRRIQPLFARRTGNIIMAIVTILSFGIQWYALNYLPVKDCLPFKRGNHIPDQMKMPADAVPDSTVITFVYRKGGKNIEFTADKFPADFDANTYQYVDRFDKIVRKGRNNEPPIKGFSLTGSAFLDTASGETRTNDSTNIVLEESYAILLFDEYFATPASKWKNDFQKIYKEARRKHISAYAVTTSRENALRLFAGTDLAGITIFNCDYTVIRTAARAYPTLYILKEGTVVDKWSYREFDQALAAVEKIPMQPKPGDIAAPRVNDSIKVKADTTNH